MHGKGGKGGGLLPSCGREGEREEVGGATKPAGSKVGGSLQKGVACQQRDARREGEWEKGKGRGRGETRKSAPPLQACRVPLGPARLHTGNVRPPCSLAPPRLHTGNAPPPWCSRPPAPPPPPSC